MLTVRGELGISITWKSVLIILYESVIEKKMFVLKYVNSPHDVLPLGAKWGEYRKQRVCVYEGVDIGSMKTSFSTP